LSADLMGWHDEHSPDHRRRMRNAMLVSLAFHGSIFAAFAITPSRAIMPMPDVIAIELVAAAPAPTRASRPAPPPAPAPETAAPEPPPTEPPPPEPPPPAPPVVKAPVQVLPEESPGRIREAPPEEVAPKIVAKVQPEPKPAPVRPKREKALSYEDAMAALDDEMGVDETADLLQPPPDPAQNQDSSGEPEPSETSQTGAVVSAAVARWNLDTRRKIQNNWVTPSSFRNRGLQTTLEFRLSASGAVIGDPKVVRSSGVPNFDDNAVRAILKAAPLAPPPEPGRQIFIFRAEDN
jgi:TonB family protein